MKIIFPDEVFTKEEVEEVLKFSIEMRKRVKDQILKIDETFTPVNFGYVNKEDEQNVEVLTLEEIQYPKLSASKQELNREEQNDENSEDETKDEVAAEELVSGEHQVIQDNMKGISYKKLFERHLLNSSSLIIEDPYIRKNHQFRNLMEFLEMFYNLIPEGEEGEVHLLTVKDEDSYSNQEEDLNEIVDNFEPTKLKFTFELKDKDTSHARSIITDTGWKISLDRGLDIFQYFDFSKV